MYVLLSLDRMVLQVVLQAHVHPLKRLALLHGWHIMPEFNAILALHLMNLFTLVHI